jgi:hypothetical protein
MIWGLYPAEVMKMGDVKPWHYFFLPVLSAIATFAVTASISAAAGMFIIAIVYGLLGLLAFIPIGGVFAQYYVTNWVAAPWLVSTFAIPASAGWIISVLFWINIVGGTLITIIMTLFIVMIFSEKMGWKW